MNLPPGVMDPLFLHYVEDRRFGLGSAAYELGSAYQRQKDVVHDLPDRLFRLT